MSSNDLFVLYLVVALSVMMWKLDSLERRLKEVQTELRKTSLPSATPMTEEEAELERRRAAIREVQENWPTYK